MGLCNFALFEKFTRAYLHRIALKIISLRIQISCWSLHYVNFLSLDGYDQDFSRNTIYTAALATLGQESKEKCVLYAALDLQNSNTRSSFLWNAVNRFVRFVKRANIGISDATVMAQE